MSAINEIELDSEEIHFWLEDLERKYRLQEIHLKDEPKTIGEFIAYLLTYFELIKTEKEVFNVIEQQYRPQIQDIFKVNDTPINKDAVLKDLLHYKYQDKVEEKLKALLGDHFQLFIATRTITIISIVGFLLSTITGFVSALYKTTDLAYTFFGLAIMLISIAFINKKCRRRLRYEQLGDIYTYILRTQYPTPIDQIFPGGIDELKSILLEGVLSCSTDEVKDMSLIQDTTPINWYHYEYKSPLKRFFSKLIKRKK